MMDRLTEREPYWLGEEFWTSAKEPDDEEIDNVYAKLKEYEDLEEQGLLIRLPCKPSDVTVYQLRNKKHALGIGVSPRRIYCTSVWADGDYALNHQGTDDCLKRDFNKTWFLTKEEAERALEERK